MKRRKLSPADLSALHKNPGPVVQRFAPGAERGTIHVPDAPMSRRDRRRKGSR